MKYPFDRPFSLCNNSVNTPATPLFSLTEMMRTYGGFSVFKTTGVSDSPPMDDGLLSDGSWQTASPMSAKWVESSETPSPARGEGWGEGKIRSRGHR
jgi:hypothetical protein